MFGSRDKPTGEVDDITTLLATTKEIIENVLGDYLIKITCNALFFSPKT
jgi:hypothetical protein